MSGGRELGFILGVLGVDEVGGGEEVRERKVGREFPFSTMLWLVYSDGYYKEVGLFVD